MKQRRSSADSPRAPGWRPLTAGTVWSPRGVDCYPGAMIWERWTLILLFIPD